MNNTTLIDIIEPMNMPNLQNEFQENPAIHQRQEDAKQPTRRAWRAFSLPAVALAALCLTSSWTYAASTTCPEDYAQGDAPAVLNTRLATSTKELCNPGYAVFYSGVARAPLWSAEHLSPGRMREAVGQPRTNDFREDTRLPADWRATLSDFKRSGFDRGHMSPAGDMPNPAADHASFLLSNMIAQDPTQNREQWEAIESAVRAMAMHRELFVITGPMWLGTNIARLHGRVLIPTHIYKVVYDPRENKAAAYVVENTANRRYQMVAIPDLEKVAGIDFFPGKAIDATPLRLARPRYR